jgi:trans-aconitate methyltransferase
MQWVIDHWELLAAVLVNLLAVAAAVVKLTPSVSDDAWIEKIQEVVESVVNKKTPQ